MKKELFALLLLLSLIVGAAFHVRHINRLTAALTERIDLSESAAEYGDFAAAEYYISSAIELWESADRYTHIFISHSETDAAADCFFDAAATLTEDEDEVARAAAFDALRYHIDSIADMERVSIGSIF